MGRAALVSILSLSILASTGCGGVGEVGGGCNDAANHLATCMGDSVANAYFNTCNPDKADQLLAQDCDGVRQTLFNSGKSDDLDEAVKQAVRDAIRDAVVMALQQAWQQIIGALGLNLADRPIYLQFAQYSTRSRAEKRAAELSQALAADPDFQPIVHKMGMFKYAVLHGACPLDPGSDLPNKVADLVMNNPELIKALGGSIDVSQTEEGAEVNMHLPLTLLSMGKDTPSKLGCDSISSDPSPEEPGNEEPNPEEPEEPGTELPEEEE